MMETEDEEVSRVIKEHAEYFAAPADLRASIEAMIPVAPTPAKRVWPSLVALLPWISRSGARVGFGFAAGVIVALLGVRLFMDIPHPENADLVALLSDHARSLATDSTIEVPSKSTHTVKPWLSAKLGYSPDVVDLTDAGFPLVGGRRGFLGAKPVAVMVYAYREHEIDVYALRLSESSAATIDDVTRDGYHVISWREQGFQYVAVSDVSIGKLDEFVRTMRRQQGQTSD
jgi:anti-sigma factor RsiW